jgi:hypothetical protein
MSASAANQGVQPGPWKFLRQRSIGSTLAWAALLLSMLLPWSIAVGVKLYLDSQGKPTWDWLYFAHPTLILYELWATLWFALPGIGVALLCYLLFTNRFAFSRRLGAGEKSAIALASLLVGAIGSIPTFISVFMEFHPIVLMLPFFVMIPYVGYYALGLVAGIVMALGSYGIRLASHPDKPGGTKS